MRLDLGALEAEQRGSLWAPQPYCKTRSPPSRRALDGHSFTHGVGAGRVMDPQQIKVVVCKGIGINTLRALGRFYQVSFSNRPERVAG